MTFAEIRTLIEAAAHMGVKVFTVTGGEPTIRKDFVDVVRCIKSNGMDCTVLSNGTLIDPSMAEALVAARLDSLNLSVDGPESVHNSIRGGSDSFARTIAAVRSVNEAKARAGARVPAVELGFTILSMNASQLTEMVMLARSLGVGVGFGYLHYITTEMLDRTRPHLDIGEFQNDIQEVPAELRCLPWRIVESEVRRARQEARKSGISIRFSPDLNGREIERRHQDDDFVVTRKCLNPWVATRVNPYGIVYPCPISIPMGSVKDRSLENIWNSNRYVQFRRKLRERRRFAMCSKCCALNNRIWDYLPGLPNWL